MGHYSQAGRAISLLTPLGPDAFLLESVTGSEGISELFRFELEMLAEVGTPIEFERVLGKHATVTLNLPNGSQRRIDGIISRLTEGNLVVGTDGAPTFVRYRAELVPEFWLLTHRVQSRVFQRVSVWDILDTLLHDEWQLSVSLQRTSLHPRNYCVQYQESDFAFLSRLMEEEGLCYYFAHGDRGPSLIVADGAATAPDLSPAEPIVFDDRIQAMTKDRPCVRVWEKTQEVRPTKHTLRDYHFQKPEAVLEKTEAMLHPGQVAVGRDTHALNVKLAVEGELLETFDYPGHFTPRIDGIDQGGAPQPQELEQLYEQARRSARLRMEQDAARSLVIHGVSDAAHLLPGHRLEVAGHFRNDAGAPMRSRITRVEHRASVAGTYTSNPDLAPTYENRFTSLPDGIVFRAPSITPRPRIEGYQTAVVTGVARKPLDVDLYGRVKVKFHWDRRPHQDENSSCWVRVAQLWAGKGWGGFFWPRPGHEVVVAFENGDPDRPLIVGSTYNETNRPPYNPPEYPALAGIKSCILGADPLVRFNAVIFHDLDKQAYVQMHSEKNEIVHNESVSTRYARTQVNINGSF